MASSFWIIPYFRRLASFAYKSGFSSFLNVLSGIKGLKYIFDPVLWTKLEVTPSGRRLGKPE